MPRESLALRRETGGGELRPATGSANEYNSALRSESTYVPSELALPQIGITIEDVSLDTVRVSFDQTSVPDDPTFGEWTEAVIVKSTAGIPLDSLGGVHILRVANTEEGLSQFEGGWVNTLDGPLEGGRWYYYALFARYFHSGNVYWLKVGEATWLNPYPFGYGERFWRMIPEHYRSEDQSHHVGGGLLRRVCDALGYEFDVARTWCSTIGDVWDFEKISAKLLPEAAHALGQPLESASGDKRMRSLLLNLMPLRKTKGTIDGIEGYVSALTGYRVKVFDGLNILLRLDDAEAAVGAGGWTGQLVNGTVTGTVSRQVSVSAPANGPAIGVPYIRNTNGTGAGTTGTLTLPVSTDIGSMVPVIEGHEYKFGVNITASGASTPINIGFVWRGPSGSVLSTTTESLGSVGGGVWARLVTAWVTAPAGAVLLQLTVGSSSGTGVANGANLQIWRALLADRSWQPEGLPGASGVDTLDNVAAPITSYENPSYYEAPRTLYVSVFPRRANLARNSNFKLDGSGGATVDAWVIEDTATFDLIPVGYPTFDDIPNADPGEDPLSEDSFLDLSADIDPLTSTATVSFNVTDGEMTVDVPGPAPFVSAVKTHWFPVMPSEDMSAAIVASASVADTQVRLRMRWFAEKTVGSMILNDDGTIAETVSPLYTLPVSGTGERIVLQGARSPDGAAYGRLFIETSNTVAHAVTFQQALIEPAATPGTYFDGNDTEGDFGDFFFANGQPQWTTESAYYPSFRSFLSNPGGSARAPSIIAEVVPAGTPVRLLTAANGLYPLP